METKKYPKYDENKKRPFLLTLSFALSLLLVFAAFETRSYYDDELVDLVNEDQGEKLFEDEILELNLVPPPPPPAPSPEIVEVKTEPKRAKLAPDKPIEPIQPAASVPNDININLGAIAGPEPEDDPGTVDIADQMPRYEGQHHNKLTGIVAGGLDYPNRARRMGIQGTVYLQITIGKDGQVQSLEVIKSAHPLLDEAALEAVRSLDGEWTPGILNNKLVNVRFVLPVSFRLHN